MAIPTSTVRLDTLEFMDSTERCRLRANEFSAINVRLAGEVAV
jgi:hypothetical protein